MATGHCSRTCEWDKTFGSSRIDFSFFVELGVVRFGSGGTEGRRRLITIVHVCENGVKDVQDRDM